MPPLDATRVSIESHRRVDQEGRRDPSAPPEQVAGLRGLLPHRGRQRRHELIGLFDTSAQADESTRVAATWVREEKLETALPNPPKITDGEVIVHKNGFVRA